MCGCPQVHFTSSSCLDTCDLHNAMLPQKPAWNQMCKLVDSFMHLCGYTPGVLLESVPQCPAPSLCSPRSRCLTVQWTGPRCPSGCSVCWPGGARAGPGSPWEGKMMQSTKYIVSAVHQCFDSSRGLSSGVSMQHAHEFDTPVLNTFIQMHGRVQGTYSTALMTQHR